MSKNKEIYLVTKFLTHQQYFWIVNYKHYLSRIIYGQLKMELELNGHNKKEFPPMHTAEHLLNQTMIRMFGCERSKSSHIERKKSKCDYFLDAEPTEKQISEIEDRINAEIKKNLEIKTYFVDRNNVPDNIDLSKLPEDASQTLRLVYVGDYDVCACIGDHVENTSQIGKFKIISTDFAEGKLRIRFKLEGCSFNEISE